MYSCYSTMSQILLKELLQESGFQISRQLFSTQNENLYLVRHFWNLSNVLMLYCSGVLSQ